MAGYEKLCRLPSGGEETLTLAVRISLVGIRLSLALNGGGPSRGQVGVKPFRPCPLYPEQNESIPTAGRGNPSASPRSPVD